MAVTTNPPCAMQRNSLWFSFSAAFASASLFHPPPMIFHMKTIDCASHVGTLFSVFHCNGSFERPLSSKLLSFSNSFIEKQMKSQSNEPTSLVKQFTPRIAVIGGGIAGVTAASALAKRLERENTPFKLVLFEQDIEGGQREVKFGEFQQPIWTAGEQDTVIDTVVFL